MSSSSAPLVTEAQHYRAKTAMYRAICRSMIIRLEDDEPAMRDLVQKFWEAESSPEYNSPEWREINGIPFNGTN